MTTRTPARVLPRRPPSRMSLLIAAAFCALLAMCIVAAFGQVPLTRTAGATAELATSTDIDTLLRAAQERESTRHFMAGDAAAATSTIIPGFGYVMPPGACSCLRRNSAAGGPAGGPLDCWRMDTTADPFPSRPGHQVPADYDATVARYHLHARSIDYYEHASDIPEGEEAMVRGYIANACDAERWLGYCADLMRTACLNNAFGTAATHDCRIDPNNGVTVRELTDWLVVTRQPGACPSPFTAWWSPQAPLPFADGFEHGMGAWRKG